MLVAEIDGLKYCRLLAAIPANKELSKALNDYEYIFIIGYEKWYHPQFEIIQKKSALILFEESIEKTFEKFRPSCRRLIRRSIKEKSLDIEFEISDWEEFYLFHKKCEKERNWKPAPIEELKASKIIAVKYNNQYLAAMSCYMDNSYMRIGRIFSRRKSNDFAGVSGVIFGAASRKIIYEFCKWGIKNSYTFLDLGGIDVNEDSKSGISHFKMEFGSIEQDVFLGRRTSTRFENLLSDNSNTNFDIT